MTEAEFFAHLKADPRNIMPRHDRPDVTRWVVVATGEEWGRSTPGWRNVNTGAPVTWTVHHAKVTA